MYIFQAGEEIINRVQSQTSFQDPLLHLIGDPQIFIGDPKLIIEDPNICIKDPLILPESKGYHNKIGVSNGNQVVSSEKFSVLNELLRVSDEYLHGL